MLGENVSSNERDLVAIKGWLKKQPHLPDINDVDDVLIMNFLECCKFSIERTKKKLEMYFTIKAAVPEFFTNRDISRPEIQEVLNIVQTVPMPQLTPEGKRVVVSRTTTPDFDNDDGFSWVKLITMLGDIRLKQKPVGATGDIHVVDATAALFKHFSKISPICAKKFFVCMQEAYPFRLSEIHIINPTPLVDFLIKWVSPFVKGKVMKRIHVHQDLESLFEHIPKEVLPEEFGGTAGKLQEHMDERVKMIEELADWLKEQEGVKADLAKRPGRHACHEMKFGMEGSFRMLTID